MKLTHLHLQLTRACNLGCPFCGQRGEPASETLTPELWRRVLDEAARLEPRPMITLWGGEALLSPDFGPLAEYAAGLGLELELITNGTLLDRHTKLLQRAFRRIYVSVDGPEAVHDALRGVGVFAQVKRNLDLLAGHGPELIMMSVLMPQTFATMRKAPFGLPVKRVILHELIYLAPGEIPGSGAEWSANYAPDYPRRLAETLWELRTAAFPVPVEFQPHDAAGICREPMRHLHIHSDGQCGFCTDFTADTVGNVKDRSLGEIFQGEEADRLRRRIAAGEFPYCRHCSWKNTSESILHFSNQTESNRTAERNQDEKPFPRRQSPTSVGHRIA